MSMLGRLQRGICIMLEIAAGSVHLRRLAAAAFVSALLGAVPAGAQAPLDLTIDPTQGEPGTTVNGQVDPADVAASCVTDLTEFQARFEAVITGPFAGGGAQGELFER